MSEIIKTPQQIFDKANSYFENEDYVNYIDQIIKLYSLIQCNCFFRDIDELIFREQADFIDSTNFNTPDWAENFAKGFIYLKNKKENFAYHYFTKALQIKEHPLLYSLRSSIPVKDNPNPLKDSLKAIDLNPSARNYFICASNYDDLKNEEGGRKKIEYLSKAIASDPKFACAYNNRAIQYDRNKNLDAAISDYKLCLQYQSDHWAYESLIKCLLKKNQIGEALFYCDLAIENSEDKENYIIEKSNILIHILEFEEAIRHLKSYHEIYPDNYKIEFEIEKTETKKINGYLVKAEESFKKNKFSEAIIYYQLYKDNGKPLFKNNLKNFLISLLKTNNENFDLEESKLKIDLEKPYLNIKEYGSYEKLNFGKYEGKVIDKVKNSNPGYILWCVINLDHFAISNVWFLQSNLRMNNLYYHALEINLVKQEFIIPHSNYNPYQNQRYEDPNPMNSEFYNDNLDMDQQSPEFWDSI